MPLRSHSMILVLALAGGCSSPSLCTSAEEKAAAAERLLQEIRAAHDDSETERFVALSREMLRRYPDHPERDRVRYELALQLVAENLMTPESAGARDVRALLAVHEREARSEDDRFRGALLRAKFSPSDDPAVTSRRLVEQFDDDAQVKEILVWGIAELVVRQRIQDAAALAKELLRRQPNVEGAKKYHRIIRRSTLPEQPAPFTTEERAELSDALSGKVVLIDFWASWCRPCLMAIPDLTALHHAHQADGLRIIGINVEDEPTFLRASQQYPVPWTVTRARSEDLLDRFGVDTLPAYILLDREGRVIQTDLRGDALYAKIRTMMR